MALVEKHIRKIAKTKTRHAITFDLKNGLADFFHSISLEVGPRELDLSDPEQRKERNPTGGSQRREPPATSYHQGNITYQSNTVVSVPCRSST